MRLPATAALFLLALPGLAHAQAYQCTAPRRFDPPRPVQPDGEVRRVPVAGYVLAASWSPEYCRRPQDKGTMQCSGQNGRFGFVLHGLWPEAANGPPPQWCSLTPRPSPQVVRRNLCMTPVPWLIEHEWAKHGSCMARTPEAYYRSSAALWRSLHWPDADRFSRQEGLTVGDLRKAFLERNPHWRAEQVKVRLSDAGWLREIHLCYGRDFMPTACDRQDRGPPDSAPLKIWRGL
ncbi:ribonuclease T2 family protein [Novosphingobium sp. JCM 18896]|uniref:ribonuclease T2 family protein n=1 Tax=Novosphingobium sp. JCM 18896 TaxID=2989731 RepID=UPI0022225766|nr:ribonuclease T [Novosphingobium sp. JCM 18896]MCW1429205.1 ribonuclease T [Novosphingobium sp. JCM 18896]